jgi:hypothetical protein
MKFHKIAILTILFILNSCSPKSNLNFYVPNISRENLIADLSNSGLKLNRKSDEIIEIENLKSNVTIEICIGDFDLVNRTVEVGLMSIYYRNVNEKSTVTELTEEGKEQFKEIFSDEVLPYIARIE